MKQRFWIIIFVLVISVCAALWLFMQGGCEIAGIYKDGELVRKIDLAGVTSTYEIKLHGEYGENIVEVSKDGIRMKSAECPDKVCVKHGALKSKSSPIVCLPNKIVIKYEEKSADIDAAAGAAG